MTAARVYGFARALLDEFTARLAETRAGAPEFAVVHPGNLVPQYGCSVAAVRVVNIAAIPNPRNASACPTEYYVALELSIDRCYRTPDNNGMPPLPVLDSAARDEIEDAEAARAAAVCAFPNRAQIGLWTPRGPAGGIHGGALAVTFRTDLGCGCGTDLVGVDSKYPMITGDPRS